MSPDVTKTAHGAVLAGMRGRLIVYRLSTPVLERMQQLTIGAAHGRRDPDPVVRAVEQLRRDVEGTLRRRALLDRQRTIEAAPARPSPAAVSGSGTRVPVGPTGPAPLPSAQQTPEYERVVARFTIPADAL